MTTLDPGPAVLASTEGLGGLEVTAERIGHDLVRLLRVVARQRHHSDIAVASVLRVLLERGPQRVGEIATALGSDPSTVSRKVAALVDAGLVERRADPDDGRAHLLAATESGKQQCALDRRHRNALFAAVLSAWSEDSRHQLATLLGRLADELQEPDRRAVRRPGGEN